MCCIGTLICKTVVFGLNTQNSCLKCKEISIEILYGIYMINCDSVDDDTVAVMIDAGIV